VFKLPCSVRQLDNLRYGRPYWSAAVVIMGNEQGWVDSKSAVFPQPYRTSHPLHPKLRLRKSVCRHHRQVVEEMPTPNLVVIAERFLLTIPNRCAPIVPQLFWGTALGNYFAKLLNMKD
jgi:hypothetical protein